LTVNQDKGWFDSNSASQDNMLDRKVKAPLFDFSKWSSDKYFRLWRFEIFFPRNMEVWPWEWSLTKCASGCRIYDCGKFGLAYLAGECYPRARKTTGLLTVVVMEPENGVDIMLDTL
jgi:hypothetical protein